MHTLHMLLVVGLFTHNAGPGEAHIDWSGQYSAGADPRIVKRGGFGTMRRCPPRGDWGPRGILGHAPPKFLDYTFNFLQSGAIWVQN